MARQKFCAHQSNRRDVSSCHFWQAKRQSASVVQRTRVTSFMTHELQTAFGTVLLDKVSTPICCQTEQVGICSLPSGAKQIPRFTAK